MKNKKSMFKENRFVKGKDDFPISCFDFKVEDITEFRLKDIPESKAEEIFFRLLEEKTELMKVIKKLERDIETFKYLLSLSFAENEKLRNNNKIKVKK